MKRTMLAGSLFLAMTPAAWAQTTVDCQTISNDVMVTDLHAYMPQETAGPSGLGDRTSGQILARWATIQDPDPEACGTLKLVEQRLAAEDRVAASQCTDLVATVRERAEAARSEAAILCRRR
jgi:hypothetical protein